MPVPIRPAASTFACAAPMSTAFEHGRASLHVPMLSCSDGGLVPRMPAGVTPQDVSVNRPSARMASVRGRAAPRLVLGHNPGAVDPVARTMTFPARSSRLGPWDRDTLFPKLIRCYFHLRPGSGRKG